jgi:hypothetical protein
VTATPTPTTDPAIIERLERLERAVGQVGYHLNRTSGSRTWRLAPDLLALTELVVGAQFDPLAPTRG